ncbi:MAG: ATP-binding protein [Actinomycetota bacterium]
MAEPAAAGVPAVIDGARTDDDSDRRIAQLERRLERARAENDELENLIEVKTRSLYLAQEELRGTTKYLEDVLASMHAAVVITDERGVIRSVGGRTEELTGRSHHELLDEPIDSVLVLDPPPVDVAAIAELASDAHEGELVGSSDRRIPVLVAASTLGDDGITGAVFTATDISERKRLELELRHAQRLESIGELAAGVAHEINTPIQYVSDGARFVGEAVDDLLTLVAAYDPVLAVAAGIDEAADPVAAVAHVKDEIELPFLADELPGAVKRTLDGVDRVATIVQALKQFSHPGSEELMPVDVNALIENTLTVARGEYKYVAEIELALGDVPEIMGDPGDLGQVLLNLVINASHAIADHRSATGVEGLGRIAIGTSADDEAVTIHVADNGGGIPAEIRDRVFEPFFTTKEPGRGTGQGLAISHNQVVKKHDGRIDFDVEDGVGTTFRIWLPRVGNT